MGWLLGLGMVIANPAETHPSNHSPISKYPLAFIYGRHKQWRGGTLQWSNSGNQGLVTMAEEYHVTSKEITIGIIIQLYLVTRHLPLCLYIVEIRKRVSSGSMCAYIKTMAMSVVTALKKIEYHIYLHKEISPKFEMWLNETKFWKVTLNFIQFVFLFF